MRNCNSIFTACPLAVLVLLSSCSEGNESSMPFIQIRSNLADGTTNVAQGPFAVRFDRSGVAIEANTTAQLSARLTMRTWPEGEIVPVDTMFDPISTDSVVISVSPISPLQDRWYSLEFGSREDGFRTEQTFDNGVWGVRLRPGSHPAARQIMFCGSDEIPGMKFIVSFSEPVTADAPANAFALQRNGVAVGCSPDGMLPDSLHAFCADLSTGPVTVTMSDGVVRGPDGSFLSSKVWTVDTSTLPLVEAFCRGYSVPL